MDPMLMDPMLKALCYALHDTYGYHEDEQEKAREILNHLGRNRVFLISGKELDAIARESYHPYD